VLRSSQTDMLDDSRMPRSAPELLRAAISSRPEGRSNRGYVWSIANLEEVDPHALYFRLGRESRSSFSIRDDHGDFTDIEFDAAPYTHVLLDVPLEVCAIAHRASVGFEPETAAHQLENMLNRSYIAQEYRVHFTVSTIAEPERFLQTIQTSWAITRFTVYFTTPNPFDVNEEFLRPMEEMTQAVGGVRGSVSITGENLELEPLTEITRSAAATGDEVKVLARPVKGARSKSFSLQKSSTAQLSQATIESSDQRLNLITRIRAKYQEIRGRGDEGKPPA
jgi:hypothetical protein